ncbi:hypothetical protein G2W53_028976 [Senna tora]|uniref:Uncharacterized protein n=1 Tax=Senna tora TaxID=362788 RepID=A0A834T4B8_9FABA|nr:hypothetical protein G2W53_028976 [Senna tora]
MAGEPLRPLKEYFTPSNYDSPSSTRLPEIGANQFEIKPSIIQMLPSFYGLSSENPYKHIDEFLEVCSTFKLPNVFENAIRLCIDHNFQNQVLSALKNLDPMRQLLDSHTQSIAKLETLVGQLANTITRRDEGKLLSFPMENPRGQTYQEETKAVTTLRSGKIIDNKVEGILNFWTKTDLMDQFMKAHDYPRKFLEVRATGYSWSFVKVRKCLIPAGSLFDKKKQILNLLHYTAD